MYVHSGPRSVSCCVSDNHIARVTQGLIPKGSFAKITLVRPTDAVIRTDDPAAGDSLSDRLLG